MNIEHFYNLILFFNLNILFLIFLFYLFPFFHCLIFHWLVEIVKREKSFEFFYEYFFISYCYLFNLANYVSFYYWFSVWLDFLGEFYWDKFVLLFFFSWIKKLLLLLIMWMFLRLQVSHNIHFHFFVTSIDRQKQVQTYPLNFYIKIQNCIILTLL